MTFHFPEDVPTNMLTNDQVDPLVRTAIPVARQSSSATVRRRFLATRDPSLSRRAGLRPGHSLEP